MQMVRNIDTGVMFEANEFLLRSVIDKKYLEIVDVPNEPVAAAVDKPVLFDDSDESFPVKAPKK